MHISKHCHCWFPAQSVYDHIDTHHRCPLQQWSYAYDQSEFPHVWWIFLVLKKLIIKFKCCRVMKMLTLFWSFLQKLGWWTSAWRSLVICVFILWDSWLPNMDKKPCERGGLGISLKCDLWPTFQSWKASYPLMQCVRVCGGALEMVRGAQSLVHEAVLWQ